LRAERPNVAVATLFSLITSLPYAAQWRMAVAGIAVSERILLVPALAEAPQYRQRVRP
jgi:hypothetical protein